MAYKVIFATYECHSRLSRIQNNEESYFWTLDVARVTGGPPFMNNIPSWCHMASLIIQNKKERALALHRLQADSWASPASALQEEADLLWAFADSRALHKYHHAAQLYRQENNLIGALRVYEHLLALRPLDAELRLQIIVVSLELCDEARVNAQLDVLHTAVEEGEVSANQMAQLQLQLVKRYEVLERQGIKHAPRREGLQ